MMTLDNNIKAIVLIILGMFVFSIQDAESDRKKRIFSGPKIEIDKRASILRKISNERLNKHLKNKIGSIQKVLVEGNAKGFTEDYSRVSFEEGPEIGEIINMKIEKKYNNELFGTPIN